MNKELPSGIELSNEDINSMNKAEINREITEVMLDEQWVKDNETDEEAKKLFQDHADKQFIRLVGHTVDRLETEQNARQNKRQIETTNPMLMDPVTGQKITPAEHAEQVELQRSGALDRPGH